MAWDLFMQAGHQSHAGRLVNYFASSLRPRVFPGPDGRFAGSATELQPCLALFERLLLTPPQLLAWFASSVVKRHVTRLYWMPADNAEGCMSKAWAHAEEGGCNVICDGEAMATNATHADCDAGDGCHTRGCIVTHAEQTCGGEVPVTTPSGRTRTREELLQSVSSWQPPPGVVLRLCCSPKSLESYLEVGTSATLLAKEMNIHESLLEAQLPEERFLLHPQHFTHVLQAVEGHGWLRWSVVPASWLYRQKMDEAKVLPESIAHAVNKLDEALHVMGLGPSARLTAAIDLGAAPGAWSLYLASLAELVIAVDPAELHPDACKSNIHHLRLKAEDAGDSIRAVLAGRQADLLTCDMNMHPMRASQAMLSLLPFLKPGGYVILTLKFTGTGRDRSKLQGMLQELYAGVLETGTLIWLLANTVCEQTWIARKP